MSGAGPSFSYFGHTAKRDPATDRIERARRPGPKKQPAKKTKPEKILQTFNTWAFKREQPDNTEAMRRVIAEAMKNDQPIQFVLYWGKGPRSHLDTPDTTCLDYLDALAGRVRAAYMRGASVKLIFTDTHAMLNGHSPQSVAQYFEAVSAAASAYGFTCCRLSELVSAAAAAGVTDVSSTADLAEDTLQRLTACAAKWFKGEGTSEEGAVRYYEMNLIEKLAVQHAFPSAIFVTFNGSEFRCLFPDRLPIFYMYSLRRGVSAKPWFLSSETIGSGSSQAVRG